MPERLMFKDVEATYNPVVGCLHGCVYCWARKIAVTKFSTLWYYQGFKPNLVEERLKRPPPKGLVFVSDMGDMWGRWVPREWIMKVLRHLHRHRDGRRYLFLTKNPERYLHFLGDLDPELDVLGATIETDLPYISFTVKISDAPDPIERINAMIELRRRWSGQLFVSIEPILRFRLDVFTKALREIKPDFVYIGYDNHNCMLPEPTLEETLKLIERLEEFTVVKRKTLRKAWFEVKLL